MSKKNMKANGYDKVKEALIEISGQDLVKKLKNNISVTERKMYHVILVKIRLVSGSIKNDVKMSVHKYHKNGFDKIQKSFTGQYDKIFVLHNPEEDDEEEDIRLPQHQISKTEEEIRAEVEAENEKEIQRRVDKALKSQKEAVKLRELKGAEKIDVSGLVETEPTVDQMREFAKANKLSLKSAKTKDEVTQALKDSVEEYNAKIDQANQLED